MSVAIPIPLLQNLPDVNVSLGVGVDEYALTYDHDTARFVLRAPFDGTPYALLAGRAGGQTLYGGTAANDDLTIAATSNATTATAFLLLQPLGGPIGVGTSSPNIHSALHLVTQTSEQPRGICIDNYTDTTSAGSIILRKARGTPAAPAAINVNDGVGAVCFSGWNGVDFGTFTRHAATIQVLAAENWENGKNGCNMIFTVTPALSEIPFTALTVQHNGAIGIGTGAPQELLHVSSSQSAVKTLTECTLSTGYAFKRLKNDTGAIFDVGLMGSAKTSTTFGVANAALAAIYYAGNLAIGTTADFPLTLGTNLIARATILGDGKFGIGTVTPATSLHVKGTTSAVVEIEGTGDTTSAIYLQSNAVLKGLVGYSAGNRALQLSHREAGTVFTNYDLVIKDGKVGIGTVAPDQQLHVKGATSGVAEIEGTGDTASAIYLQSNLLLKSLVGYSAANDALQLSHREAGTVFTNYDLVIKEGNVGFGTVTPATIIHAVSVTATTNALRNVLTLGANVTGAGVGAAGLGAAVLFTMETSTTVDTSAASVQAIMYEATHASRKFDLVGNAYDTAIREGWRVRGNGSAPAIGFLGATPQARIAHVADPAGGATVDAEARTAINSILSTLELFGFHAAS